MPELIYKRLPSFPIGLMLISSSR